MYGYKIVGGKAEIIPEEATLIYRFVDCYLAGMSFREAKTNSWIPIGETGLRHLVENKTYLGTEFYPAILDKRTFKRIAAERKSRVKEQGRRKADPNIPVYSSFRVVKVKELPTDLIEAARVLYDSVVTTDDVDIK